jgi:hypothetical protein
MMMMMMIIIIIIIIIIIVVNKGSEVSRLRVWGICVRFPAIPGRITLLRSNTVLGAHPSFSGYEISSRRKGDWGMRLPFTFICCVGEVYVVLHLHSPIHLQRTVLH